VISCSGLTPDGPNDVNPNAAAIKRAMMARAETNMLLIDQSKFDLLTLENICALERIKLIVADRAPGGELARALKRSGIPVDVATSVGREATGTARRLATQR
jgi:DeoR family glycerol-3-phosphate regulon repressor